MRNDTASCHPERAQILSERSESKDRHPLASKDLHLPRPSQRPSADLERRCRGKRRLTLTLIAPLKLTAARSPLSARRWAD
jgi:hypothetical protein